MKQIIFFTGAVGLLALFAFTASFSLNQRDLKNPAEASPVTDTAVFFQRFCEAIEKRDVNLLSPLLDDQLYGDFADGFNTCASQSGCPKSVILTTYFQSADAPGWSWFKALARMPGLKSIEPETTGDQVFFAPNFPDQPAQNGKTRQQYAYIYADQVLIRETPDKQGKVLGKCSRRFLVVDTDQLCYDDVPEYWLPIVTTDGKAGYVFSDFTNWGLKHGCIVVKKDPQGKLKVVRMIFGRKLPGAWYLPGCC